MPRGRRRRRTGPRCIQGDEVVLRIEEPERARGSIRITKHLAQIMEWVPGETRLRVDVDAEAGRIALSEDPKGCGFRRDRRVHFAYAPELWWQIFGDGSCRRATTTVEAVNVKTSVETAISLNVLQREEQATLLIPLLTEESSVNGTKHEKIEAQSCL